MKTLIKTGQFTTKCKGEGANITLVGLHAESSALFAIEALLEIRCNDRQSINTVLLLLE